MVVGPSFSRDIVAPGRHVQILLDGRRSNGAQLVNAYLGEIVSSYIGDENEGAHRVATVPRVVTRNWFNPNLKSQWFMVPGLIASIALMIGLSSPGFR
jgi:ABC-2 type transport system permease protein